MDNQKEYLLAKSDGVKDCVKWLEKGMKERKAKGYGVGDLFETKISLDKYRKKLIHQAREVDVTNDESPKEQYLLSCHRVQEMVSLLNNNESEQVKGLLQDILHEAGYPDAYND